MSWLKRRKQRFIYRHEVHAHLLPGLDDGVETPEESAKLITRLRELGVEQFSLTPHIVFPGMPNSRRTIFPVLRQMQEALGPSFSLQAGAEYRITGELTELVRQNDLLPFAGNYLLVEHSLVAESLYFDTVLFSSLNKGYLPVLAHPERYPFFRTHIVDKCHSLRKRHCLLQVNLLSFAGFYGKESEKAAWQLLKAGLIDFVGSDMHSEKYAEALDDFLHSATADKLNRYPFRNK